jgi:uncharacterized protein YbjT (DUF2867 family)
LKNKTVLLLGATGLVGGECLKYLQKKDCYHQILILTRRPVPEQLKGPKVREYIIDFNRPETYQEYIQTDHVICAMGTTIKKAGSKENFYRTDFTYPYEISRIAHENGAEHFLLISAMGADPGSLIFYNQVKGKLENAVQKIGYRSISIFRPSLLLGDREEFRPGEEIGKFFGKFVSFALPDRYKPVHAGDVAGAVVRAAEDNQAGIRIIESDEIRRILQKQESAASST